MSKMKLPHVIVVGNEKGGAGKTTLSMHLICGFLDRGLIVSSIDVDCRQHSLTRYLQNRQAYKDSHNEGGILMPKHFLLKNSEEGAIESRESFEKTSFEAILDNAKQNADIVVIDTPGSHTFLSSLAHSYADTIITPINDSFVDLDVMAKVDEHGKVISPSIYSQSIWEQKMSRAKRDQGEINWIIIRNRLSHIDARNKLRMKDVLDRLSNRLGFRVASGFNERVIYRELFLHGLTLLDIKPGIANITISLSHIAAKQELNNLLRSINLSKINDALDAL